MNRPRAMRFIPALAISPVADLSGTAAHAATGAELVRALAERAQACPRLRVAANRMDGIDFVVDTTLVRFGNQLQVVVRLLDAAVGGCFLVRTYTGQCATIEHMCMAIACAFIDDLSAAVSPRLRLVRAKAS